jgi:transcriptional regulator with XRE-family HTH domain
MSRSGPGAAPRPLGQARRVRSGRRGVSPRKPTAVDKHVGKRLRLLRQINEVSLEKLAEIVDVAPQQIQKYEIGETRISASRIFELSKTFCVPVAWFYHDLEATTSAAMDARIGRHRVDVEAVDRVTEASREALLLGYFAQLTPEMQHKLVDFARMLSEVCAGQAK